MNLIHMWGNPFTRSRSGHETDVQFLAGVPLFDSLSPRYIEKFKTLLHVRTFEPGEVVFRQNDPGVGMYIVRDGHVEIYREFSDATRTKIVDLTRGDFFGEISLLNESPRSGTAVCADHTKLFGIFKPDLIELMNSNPKLGLRFIYRLSQVLAERLRLSSVETTEQSG